MNAKQFLNRARRIDKEIDENLALYENTKTRLTSITQSLDGAIVSGTKDPHKFDRLVELKDTIDSQVDEFVRVKIEIYKVLMKLSDRNQRLALIAYYLEMKTWEQIAVNMSYSYQHIMWIRKQAILEVEKLLKDKIE